MTTTEFKVTGMKCGGCEKSVQEAADAVSGVLASKAVAKTGAVEVEYDPAKTSPDAIQKAIAAAGFPLA